MNYQSDTLKLETEKCTGCGLCTDVCPHAVFMLAERKAVIQHPERCMECGACMRNCQVQAIQVETGVGCAAALIFGALNKTAPQCGCSSNKSGGCC
jgi:NAD-dependent dihydropyrimidine dehydrogenase PreA subunit